MRIISNNKVGAVYDIGLVFFAIASLLINNILSNNLPVLIPAFFILCLVVSFVSIASGLVLNYSKNILRLFILTAVLFSYIDITAGGHKIVADLSVYSNGWPPIFYFSNRILILCFSFAAIFLILKIINKEANKIMMIFFATILFSNFITGKELKETGSENAEIAEVQVTLSHNTSSAPNIFIHFILDEMMSPSAFPEEISASNVIRENIRSFLGKYNFKEYTHAYSRHVTSGHSIPDTISVNRKSTSVNRESEDHVLKISLKNSAKEYFKLMSSAGYKITVFQTEHLDFCNNRYVEDCQTLDSFNPYSQYILSEADTIQKHKFYYLTIFMSFFNQKMDLTKNSYVLNYTAHLFSNYISGIPLWIDAYAFPGWFKNISDYVVNAPAGTMILAHILVPHAPYILDDECNVEGESDFPYKLGLKYNYQDREKISSEYTSQYERYFKQVDCVFGRLDQLFSRLKRTNKLKDMTVVLHGDHGSRIANEFEFVEHMNERDIIDSYASFMAIKDTMFSSSQDERFISIQDAFSEFIGLKFNETTMVDLSNYILTKDHSNKYIQKKMPDF